MGSTASNFLAEINWRLIVDVFEALLTPTIAVVTAYVAYQQWRVNRTRLDLDLYERRLAIYKALEQFHDEINIPGSIRYPMVTKLRSFIAEARFLFPTEIENYLDRLSTKAFRAATLREDLHPDSGEPGLPIGESRNNAANEESKLVDEIRGPMWDESKKLFRKYLTLA